MTDDDWEQTLIAKAQEYGIPERMIPGMMRWVKLGSVPGDFLCAVIKNNLRDAIHTADDENLLLLEAYVKWFYNWAPYDCWGSTKMFKKWKKRQHV